MEVMVSEPLQPFESPTAIFEKFDIPAISAGSVVFWVLLAVFAFWVIYTIVVTYHWLKYSHASGVAFPAIGVHLLVSAAIMAYALTGSIPYF